MTPDGRAVLERAIQRVADQAANAHAIVDEAITSGLDGSDKLVISTKMLRAELLSVKADLERELEREYLDCVVCGVPAHYVGGLGFRRDIGRTPHLLPTQRPSWSVRGLPPDRTGIVYLMRRYAVRLDTGPRYRARLVESDGLVLQTERVRKTATRVAWVEDVRVEPDLHVLPERLRDAAGTVGRDAQVECERGRRIVVLTGEHADRVRVQFRVRGRACSRDLAGERGARRRDAQDGRAHSGREEGPAPHPGTPFAEGVERELDSLYRSRAMSTQTFDLVPLDGPRFTRELQQNATDARYQRGRRHRRLIRWRTLSISCLPLATPSRTSWRRTA